MQPKVRIITAPTIPRYSDYTTDLNFAIPNRETLFLAGGISNCEDWQSYFCKKFESFNHKMCLEMYLETAKYYADNAKSLLVFNPRRENFDISKVEESQTQILWEFNRLRESKNIIFWFSEETVCPITLFEYGKHLVDSSQKLFVGTHKNYLRRFDLLFQTELVRPGLEIHDSLDDLIYDVCQYFNYEENHWEPKPNWHQDYYNPDGPIFDY